MKYEGIVCSSPKFSVSRILLELTVVQDFALKHEDFGRIYVISNYCGGFQGLTLLYNLRAICLYRVARLKQDLSPLRRLQRCADAQTGGS